MKIAIPTCDGIRISSNIKRIKGFTIFEISGGKIINETYVSNNSKPEDNQSNKESIDEAAEPHTKSKEISFLTCIEDCQIVIANGLSKNMFEELLKANKEVYITEAEHIRGAINHFIRQTLRNHPEMA